MIDHGAAGLCPNAFNLYADPSPSPEMNFGATVDRPLKRTHSLIEATGRHRNEAPRSAGAELALDAREAVIELLLQFGGKTGRGEDPG